MLLFFKQSQIVTMTGCHPSTLHLPVEDAEYKTRVIRFVSYVLLHGMCVYFNSDWNAFITFEIAADKHLILRLQKFQLLHRNHNLLQLMKINK